MIYSRHHTSHVHSSSLFFSLPPDSSSPRILLLCLSSPSTPSSAFSSLSPLFLPPLDMLPLSFHLSAFRSILKGYPHASNWEKKNPKRCLNSTRHTVCYITDLQQCIERTHFVVRGRETGCRGRQKSHTSNASMHLTTYTVMHVTVLQCLLEVHVKSHLQPCVCVCVGYKMGCHRLTSKLI